MRPVFVAVGLGGNLGDPAAAFRTALDALAGPIRRLRVSGLYRTAPVGGPPQPDFLNAAAVGVTRLAPLELLALLLGLERAAGRVRSGPRNGPRPLDLDLLLYGARRFEHPALTVPHPRLAHRRFALAPLAELAPGRVVPGTSRTVARLLREAPPETVTPLGPPAEVPRR